MGVGKTHGTLRFASPAEARKGSWVLFLEPHVAMRVKRILPRIESTRRGIITVTDTPEVCRDLEWLMDRWPLEVEDRHREYLARQASRFIEGQSAVRRILDSGERLRDLGNEPIIPARDYQNEAADLCLTTGRLLLGDDLGLGKTLSSTLVLRDPGALPALVVVQTHLPEQWRFEIQKFFPWLRVHIARTKQAYDPARKRGAGGRRPDVLIVSYSKLSGWAEYLAGDVRTVIFDEIQELRHAGSQKYEAAARVADLATYRFGCSATPVYNYGGEMFNVLDVLDRGVLGSRSEFVREWGSELSNGRVKLADPEAFGSYLRELGIFLRRTRADVGRELPAAVPIPHVVDTDHEYLVRNMDEIVGLAEMILAAGTPVKDRFRASGDLDLKMRRFTGIAKAPYVADFVRMILESEEKVVLAGWHRAVYEVWNQRLAEFSPVMYTGSESPRGKRDALDAFINGDSRVLILSLRSGIGINGLQDVCKVLVLGELDHSPGVHEQIIGRLRRDGQAEPVLVYYLLSEAGSDPVMAELLALKRGQSEPLVDPGASRAVPVPDLQDRIRLMAEAVLERRGRAS